jgi:hypothetical protein
MHYEFDFCIQHEVGVRLHSFVGGYPVVLAPLVEKMISALNCFGTFVKNQLPINVNTYFLTLGSTIGLCLSFCQHHIVLMVAMLL